MSTPTGPDTTRLRCRSSADFLAALPRLTGFTADNSLFVVLFSGKTAVNAFRLDLPDPALPGSTAPFIDFIVLTLREVGARTGAADPPALVVTSDLTFAECGGAPWKGLADDLERRLEREGIGMREFCCQAPDAWISYLDPRAPASGRPLGEIERSDVARAVAHALPAVPRLETLGGIPSVDPQRARAVTAALSELASSNLPDSGRVPPPRSGSGSPLPAERTAGVPAPNSARPRSDPSGQAERSCRALLQAGDRLSPTATALLIRTTSQTGTWMMLALGLLTRPEFPREMATELGPTEFTGLRADIDSPEPSLEPGWSVRRMLLALSPEFRDSERLLPMRDPLLTAVSETPRGLRPPLLALTAWIWWLCGHQTVAQRLMRQAFEIDPGHELARAVGHVVSVPLTMLGTRRVEPGLERLDDAA